MNTLFHILRLPASVMLLAILATGASAQSELAVTPGAGTLNEAIANDTDRPDDRVYVLERGGSYAVTDEIINDGYTLRIEAAAGAGVRPVIYPGDGVASRFLDFGGDTYLTSLYVLGVKADGADASTEKGGQVGIPVRVNGAGQRLVITDCVLEGADSRYMEVTAPDTKITITDSQFRNIVRPDNVANGRAIDIRGVSADSLLIQNTSFLNVTGYVVRFDGGDVLEHFIFDHNTVHTTSNDFHTSGVGTRSVEYVVTNNLFVNVNAPGQSPTGEPEDAEGILQVNTFEGGSGFSESDRTIEISNNGIFSSPEILAYYQRRADEDNDPIIPFQLIQPSAQSFIEGSPQATAANNIGDSVDFEAPPALDSYLVYLEAKRDFQPNLPFWTFGTDDVLFPAEQPTPEDLSYGEDEEAYMAAERNFPLGDLNWFPDLKQFFLDGGTVDNAAGPVSQGGAALHTAYPNPTAGLVTMRLDLAAAADVSVRVVDLLGRVVLSTPSASVAAGTDLPIRLDASGLPSGIYLAQVTVQNATASGSLTRRFTVAR